MNDPLAEDDALAPPADPYPENELARTMTHQAQRPNPAMPYLDAVRAAGRGAQAFVHGGLTEAFPDVRRVMPGPINAVGNIFQSQPARDALSVSNLGGVPALQIMREGGGVAPALVPALRYKGKLYTGASHLDALDTAAAEHGMGIYAMAEQPALEYGYEAGGQFVHDRNYISPWERPR